MTLKIIGAVLIILACGSVGFQMAAAQRREEKMLESLCGLLDYMECELQYRMTPLPALCMNIAGQTSGPLKKLFFTLSQELESQISPDAQSCMHAALGKCTGLPKQVTMSLIELGKTLGMFDIDGQLTGLEGSRRVCELRLQSLRLNKDNRLRGYQTLGLCAGAALVILFI